MTVRLATKADEAQLVALCHELHAENGLCSMDDSLVSEMLSRAFEKRGGIIGVIDGPQGIEACIYLLLSHIWYSQDYHIEELFNFVSKPYRSSNHSMDLIEFARDSAKSLGLPLVIGILTNKQLDAKVRHYQRKLGNPSGALFVYNAQWASEAANPANWQSLVEKRGWSVPRQTLEHLGAGDADRGWSVLQKYIKWKMSQVAPQSGLELVTALSSAVATTTPMPLAANG